MAGNEMAGNGTAARHAADPAATQGGQAGSYSDGSPSRMADGGYAAQGAPMGMSDRVQQTTISAPNALLLIAGVWLIISRFVFDFPL
ncbi:MAG TPA: hypothetical protein VK659_05440, partial [Asanoa sp.]|nr:hypothetical protein [Asanoa sp.]